MVTRTSINPDELRNRFRAARRMPQLLEVQDAVRVALRQTSDAMDESDTGNGDAELTALFASLKGLIDEITARITRQATVDDLERRMQGQPLRDGGERDFTRQCCEFSLFRAAAHAIGMSGIDAGREIETQAELARRAKASGRPGFTGNVIMPIEALSVQVRHLPRGQLAKYETRDIVGPVETRVIGSTQPPGTTGGSLIGTYTDPNQYIDVLRPAMVVRQAGARVLSDLRENLRLPRMTRSGQPGWFAENSPIPITDETFDDVTLVPHHDAAIVEVTRTVLQQAQPEIESVVRNDLALKLANDIDISALAGSGVAPVPLGIITDPLVPTLTAAALGYTTPVDLIGSLATRNALNGSLAFIGDANVMVASMKLLDGMQRPYGDLLWHGYPQYWTNLAHFASAPNNPLVFGNWADLIIGFWSELDILVATQAGNQTAAPYGFYAGNVLIRAAMTLDIAKRHPESFVWIGPTGLPAMAEAEAPAAAEPARRTVGAR